jgi:alanine racemase
MNACLADVTDIPGVSPGEEVVLLGEQTCEDFSGSRQTISADEVAEWMGTISYEILCLFGSNNDRVYLHEEGFEA